MATTEKNTSTKLENPTPIIHPKVMIVTSIFWGLFGLHDFILKKWLAGAGHLALALAGIFVPFTYMPASDGTRFIIPNICLFASLGWMAIELYNYLKTYKAKYKDNPDIQYKMTMDTFNATNTLSILFSILAIIIEFVIIWAFCLSIATKQAGTTKIGHGLDSLFLMGLSLFHFIPSVFSWVFYSTAKNLNPKIDLSVHKPIERKLFQIARYLSLSLVVLLVANIALTIVSFNQ